MVLLEPVLKSRLKVKLQSYFNKSWELRKKSEISPPKTTWSSNAKKNSRCMEPGSKAKQKSYYKLRSHINAERKASENKETLVEVQN